MDIVIDVSELQAVGQNPVLAAWFVLTHGGWIGLVILALIGTYKVFILTRQNKFIRSLNYVLLAIDVPKLNEQTPKAVESFFAHLHGIQRGGNWKERVLKGYIQPPLSLEIIGIEGQIQFLLRTPSPFRDLVEAALYAQYPDAAITEVLDYTDFVPFRFEEEGYDLWGTELTLYNKDVYPIRTYPFFEHTLSGNFLDPMASLLEILGRLGPSEQVWLQIVIAPSDDSWKAGATTEIKRMLGEMKKKGGVLPLDIPRQVAQGMFESLTASIIPPEAFGTSAKTEKPKVAKKFSELTMGEKGITEAIEMKTAKLGWKSKVRMLYIAKKEFMNRSKGIAGVLGALKQFNTQNLNGFKPDKKATTSIDYLFIKRRVRARQKKILGKYKRRALWRGRRLNILNTEELATLFHFPIILVKAPQVQKTEAKRGEPPIRLPMGLDLEEPLPPVPERQPAKPPTNTPFTLSSAAAPAPAAEHAGPVYEKGAPPPNLPM